MMTQEAKNYIEELDENIRVKHYDLLEKLIKRCPPGTRLFSDETIFDKFKQIGIEKSSIEKHLTDGFKIVDYNMVESNAYFNNISLDNIYEGGISLRNVVFNKNEIDIIEQEYIDENKNIQIPIAIHKTPFKTLGLNQNNQPWMSITPNEMITMQEYIDKASGNVFTSGLGLGYFAYMCAIKPEVKSITIVETQFNIIKLFSRYILPQFGEYASKINIVKDDLFEYVELNNIKEIFDFSFIDIYMGHSDGMNAYYRLEEMLSEYTGNGVVNYWLEQGFKIFLTESLIQAISLTKVQELSNYNALVASGYNKNSLPYKKISLMKAISYIQKNDIKLETVEDIDNLIFNNKSIYKELASLKDFVSFDKVAIKPKAKPNRVKNNDSLDVDTSNSNKILKRKKQSRKQRKSNNA